MTPPDPQSDSEEHSAGTPVATAAQAEQANTGQASTGPAKAGQSRPASSSGGLAIAATVLALAAIIAAGYGLWQLQGLQSLPAKLQSDAGRVERLRADVERRQDNLSAQTQANAAALADMQVALAEAVAATADADMQIDALAKRVTEFTGDDAARRNSFLRAEALYYLRIANARVLLAHDPSTGARALQLADEKLLETGDPALTPVRAKLSEELIALRAIPQVDVPGISFRLQSLAAQVNDWPLSNPVPESFNTGLPGVAEVAGDDAWSRLKDTVTSAFRSIVSIRESEVAPDVQLSAAQQALVIESVRAELQLARLTLISGNTQLYAQSLQRVVAQIPLYFDQQASAVQAALITLNELQTLEMPGELPDVSGSLQLLLAAENQSVGGGSQQ